MKLDQKQMHIVSQLFMVASKAGRGFDLSRFSKEQEYAQETLIQLALFADSQNNQSMQTLVTNVMAQLGTSKQGAPRLQH
jgi:hypothetical protein